MFDLAKSVDRAEVLAGKSVAIDFRQAGGFKYLFDGWQSSSCKRIDQGLAVTDSRVRLALPYGFEGDGNLVIRGRAPGGGAVLVYIGDAQVGQVTLPAATVGEAQLVIPAAKLRAGDNNLLIRAANQGPVAGAGSASLVLSSMRFGPPSDAPSSEQALYEVSHEKDALTIHANTTLGYAFEIPEGAHLVGELKSGAFRVTANVDGRASADIRSLATTGDFDVDLAEFRNKIVRLDLVATSDALVDAPRVVVPRAEPVAEAPHVKNAIIYLVDTLRADKLKPYNEASRVTTPGLQRFVEHAATFLQGHTQENWTKPSVATLLSSLYPWEHNAVTDDAVVSDSVKLLPETLKSRGFFTGAFIANGYASDRFGFKQGWDTWRNYIREGRPTAAQYVASDVLGWLDHRPNDKPFFLYVHTVDPHVPYRPPQSFLSMYDPVPYGGIVDFSQDIELLEKIKAGRIHLNDRDKQHLVALYDGEISYHDVHFSAILDGLASRGLADDTIVVMVADHGEEFWDHGSVGHGHSVHEELLHIPMFVSWPGVTGTHSRIDTPAGLVDIAPTVLDALGQEIPDDVEGHSLAGALTARDETAPRAVVSGFMDVWRTLVVGNYKLVQRGPTRFMVYDLAADKGEGTDLSRERPIATRYLRGLLGLYLSESSDGGSRRATPVRHEAGHATMDEQTRAELRALGYVGGP